MPAPRTPPIAADIIIELTELPGSPIVLIERRFEPLGWAIPGGFIDVGETVEHAAVREAEEETCLRVRLTALLGCYSSPTRDPRGHTVSMVYVATALGTPRAADDAKNVGIFRRDHLPQVLAFDHALILEDYFAYKDYGRVAPLRE